MSSDLLERAAGLQKILDDLEKYSELMADLDPSVTHFYMSQFSEVQFLLDNIPDRLHISSDILSNISCRMEQEELQAQESISHEYTRLHGDPTTDAPPPSPSDVLLKGEKKGNKK